jgi:hypothetical protein
MRRDRWGRPVDPDYGIDEGDIDGGSPEFPDQGGPSPGRPGHGLPWPGYPGRPGQGLPPNYPGRPGHGLPWPGRPTDPDYGIEGPSVPGLPEVPEQGPVLPGRPGHPLPRPPIPVVSTCPLPEGVELPSGPPHLPGAICIVVASKSRKRALAWLQGESSLPEVDPTIPAPGRPGGGLPGGGVPPGSVTAGGHWVAVNADPEHACEGADDCCFAFVFEVSADFGKPEVDPTKR